jgi:hypothetical protein
MQKCDFVAAATQEKHWRTNTFLEQPHFIELDDVISRGIWGLSEEKLLKQSADPVSNLISTS